MFSGETKNIIVTITDKGERVNLDGSQIVWTMKDLQKTLADGVMITGVGEVTIRLHPDDTKNKVGLFSHHLVVTDAHGNVSTVLKENIHIKAK